MSLCLWWVGRLPTISLSAVTCIRLHGVQCYSCGLREFHKKVSGRYGFDTGRPQGIIFVSHANSNFRQSIPAPRQATHLSQCDHMLKLRGSKQQWIDKDFAKAIRYIYNVFWQLYAIIAMLLVLQLHTHVILICITHTWWKVIIIYTT